MADKNSFDISISHGYPIRFLFTLLRNYLGEYPIKFLQEGIKICARHKDERMTFNVFLDKKTGLLNEYDIYNNKHVIIIVNSLYLDNITKLIDKKSGIDLCMVEDSGLLQLQIIGKNTRHSLDVNLSYNNDIFKFPNNNSDPIFKLRTSEFYILCAELKKRQTTDVLIKCYTKGISFSGYSAEGKMVALSQYGLCEDVQINKLDNNLKKLLSNSGFNERSSANEEKKVNKINIIADQKTFKMNLKSELIGLTSLKNIAPEGLMGFYYIKEKIDNVFAEILLIKSPIGHGKGFIEIYIAK